MSGDAAAPDYFSGWEFPGINDTLKDVPYGAAAEILQAVRNNLASLFASMREDGEWDYHEPPDGVHGFRLAWMPVNGAAPFGYEFPVIIEVTPADLVDSLRRAFAYHENGDDGLLAAEARAKLLACLNAWRAALDEAEQLMEKHP